MNFLSKAHAIPGRYWSVYLVLSIVLFAVGGGTAVAQSGTPVPGVDRCDVEPLTVDRVKEIVRHPGYFMVNGPAEPRAGKPLSNSTEPELWESQISISPMDATSFPAIEQFEEASAVANQYLNCMVTGTQGQVWSLLSPSHIQRTILAEFPVYAEELDVRARVEDRITEPAYEGEWLWENLPFFDEIEGVSVNPDIELAIVQQSNLARVDQVMKIGVRVEGANSETLALTNGLGRDLIPGDPRFTRMHDDQLLVTLVQHRESNIWLIIPGPSTAELGW